MGFVTIGRVSKEAGCRERIDVIGSGGKPVPRRRKPDRSEPKAQPPDDRAWSAHTSVHPRAASTDLVGYTALPAETGPTWAPDRLSVWPVEGGRYGIDAHYHGQTGVERANAQRRRLERVGLGATVREEETGAFIRLGPLAHSAAWLALEAFLGRPISDAAP
ncbi:MAG TPA: hypothetical protein VG388_13160 [Solirubrobacteraceae bacterium]|jgi:hypothetical protein|nr:hypothetical protein [Solirubrobacteraceae bacterium]